MPLRDSGDCAASGRATRKPAPMYSDALSFRNRGWLWAWALRGLASACIDVSDGLYADMQQLLLASGCAASIEIERLPVSWALRELLGDSAWQQVLAGAEDYELCFSAPQARAAEIAALAASTGTLVTRIGTLAAGSGIELKSNNTVMQFSPLGFDHFRD